MHEASDVTQNNKLHSLLLKAATWSACWILPLGKKKGRSSRRIQASRQNSEMATSIWPGNPKASAESQPLAFREDLGMYVIVRYSSTGAQSLGIDIAGDELAAARTPRIRIYSTGRLSLGIYEFMNILPYALIPRDQPSLASITP